MRIFRPEGLVAMRRMHFGGIAEKLAAASLLLAAAAICSLGQTLITNIPTQSYPTAVALNPATNKIYVANQASNSVTVIDGATHKTTTVLTGAGPNAVAINAVTNKIYVANLSGASVTVIDGATNKTSTVGTGVGPLAIAVNSVSNKIYVANYNSQSVTMIDGANNGATDINVGTRPYAIAVNSANNRIVVANSGSGDVSVIDGTTNTVKTVTVGADPRAIAINPVTNRIYVANWQSGSVSVINGATDSVTNITVNPQPVAVAVDPVRNKILVAGSGTNSATIIDGATLATTAIKAGGSPVAIDVNPITAKAYFANYIYDGTVTMVDEVSGATATSAVLGTYANAVAIDPLHNLMYVTRPFDNSVSVLAGAAADPLQFVPVTPCRIADTRNTPGPFGGPYLSGGTTRSFAVPQSACGIPETASAYALNVSVVPHAKSLGYLTIWPTGEAQPVISTLNTPDRRVKSNAAIVYAGAGGAVSVYVSDSTDVILDINGYFRTPASQTLQFYPVSPCRVVDTRKGSTQPQGLGSPSFAAMETRKLPVLSKSPCLQGLPRKPQAYSFNFAVVPTPAGQPLNYLTAWPSNELLPLVATLTNPTATIVANAAIVPADPVNGDISVFTYNSTDVIIDVNGYFAVPGTDGLSLYPLEPCRVLDTRTSGGAFTYVRKPPVNVAGSSCGIPANAQAYVFNATAIPVGALGYLTLWPDPDLPMPGVATLNATDGFIASNMAIIGNVDGKTDAYAYGTTYLVVDIGSYFAP